MKNLILTLLIASGLPCGATSAQERTASAAPMSEHERIDMLLKQNHMLMEENSRLRSLADRPQTKEEAFAMCMQAAKGDKGAMAAESVGGHCDQLLKR
jgi:hypothetical protein